MLEHVETVIADDPLEFPGRPRLDRRHAEIHGDALERFAVLPARGRKGNQPIADRRVVNIERARRFGGACLRPVDPQAELESVRVRKLRDARDPVGKLERIRTPVAHVAKPSCIEVEHLEPELRGILDHAVRQRFVHRHAAAPAVVDRQGVGRVAQRDRILQHVSHPPPEDVAGAVRSAGERPQENRRRFERAAGTHVRTGWAGQGIQTGFPAHGVLAALERDSRPPAELDAQIPALALAGGFVDQEVRDHFPRQVLHRSRVRARRALPRVAISKRDEMGALRRRRVRAFFHPETLQRRVGIDPPIECKAALQRQRHRFIAQVLDRHGVFQRAVGGARAPAPGELEPGRIGHIHELDQRRFNPNCGAVEAPDHGPDRPLDLNTSGQRVRGAIEPLGTAAMA